MHDPRENPFRSASPEAGLEADGPCDALGAELRSLRTPDLTDGVMRGIRQLEGAPRRDWTAAIAWIWRPVSVTLRPAYGAAFALLLVIGIWAGSGRSPEVAGVAAVAPAAQTVLVHFRLEAPGATSVQLAGTFSEWNPAYSLHESLPGIWTLVVPLDAGVHDYLFVVNGDEWVPDPHAPQVDDNFGGINSRLALPSLDAWS
jgi:hypothetical protein